MKKILVLACLLLSVYVVIAQKATTYSGTIKGYSVGMGFKSGQLIINNIVTSLHETYLIAIQPDGTFSTSFPLTNNQECWISLPFFNGPVYFEPGKKLSQDFNIANIPKVFSVFKGDGKLTLINNDINKVRPVLMDYNWDTIYADVYQFTPEQYKTYFLKMQAHKLALIDSVAKTVHLNKLSYQLARQNVQYFIAAELMQYNGVRESAYRIKNKITFDSHKPVLASVKLSEAYYDFLKGIKYNNPAAIASYNYYIFINQLMIIDPIYDKAGRVSYTAQINELKKDTSNKNAKAIIQSLEDMAWHNPTKLGAMEKARPIVLKKLLNTDISLELELIYLQTVSQRVDYEKAPLSNTKLAGIKSKIKNKFLFTDVTALNNKIKQNIWSIKAQTGYTNNQVPINATADSFLVKLMDKYKGKVVFIDFWATWCVPCMIGIKEIAPLKENLAQNKGIVFLYITDTTSPEKSYQTVMPGIKGEHYRITTDQYNLLSKQFQIVGIPHYALINKRGSIVDANFHWTQTDQIKKRLLALANE